MIHISAPGKLFLSGEWAVLEVGNPGIVTAVDKRVHCEIGESDRVSVDIDDFGIKGLAGTFRDGKFSWDRELSEQERKDTNFIRASIETAIRYLGDWKPFRLHTWGELSQITLEGGEAKKIGFGSSAASVVAVISAILSFHGKCIAGREAKDTIYKLSSLTHYFAQGKVGSAFDVAASTFGGAFVYRRFDPEWLVSEAESGKSVKDLAEKDWKDYSVEELGIPEGFRLLIGWTKESASTSAMVKQLNAWAREHPGDYKKHFDRIAELVKELIPAWKAGETAKVLELLRKNEGLLADLGKASGVAIETPGLKELSELANQAGGAGKLSGAGGGDCGIAVCFDEKTAQKITEAWKAAGFHLVDATTDRDGVRPEA
jgi:phosphomevalonate kinase